MSDDVEELDGTEGVYVELHYPGSGRIVRTTIDEILALAALGTGGGGGWIYGDGSDGDLVLHDGDTWVPGFYHDVTIEAGATVRLDPDVAVLANYPFYFGTGTFTIDGTLDLSGFDSVDRIGGVNGSGYAQPVDGGTGDGLTSSAQGSPPNPGGGAGGDGSAGVGGAAGVSTNMAVQGPGNVATAIALAANNAPFGGSSGGGDGVNNGGGGGGGGGYAYIIFRHIVHGSSNVYNLQGGNGGPGGDDGTGAPNTGNGDCGGGGGGGAGWWVTLSDDLAGPDANIVGTGGAGGAGCGTGTDGSAGDDGFVIHLLNT